MTQYTESPNPVLERSSELSGLRFSGLTVLLSVLFVGHLPAITLCAEESSDVVRAQSSTREMLEAEEEIEEEPDRFFARQRAAQQRSTQSSSQVSRTAASDDGPGIIGQAGHLGFKTFGRNESITPVEALPYILTDEHFFFGDARGFVSNNGLFGGNVGLGYRNLREDYNAWYGASVWYDADGSSGKLFQQVGLSFEGLIDRFEFRSNVYLPVTGSQTFANSISNVRIVGHQLLYGQFTDRGTALRGVDFEAGYGIPFLDQYQVRGFAGYYHFEGGDNGSLNGFKTRVEGVINNAFTAQVLYTNDKLFGSNIMVGGSIQFPFGGKHPTSKWHQNTPSPFRFVERNYNVIVDHAQHLEADKVARNPTTGLEYNIQQVSSNASGVADGTSANPFATVAAAQAAGADVIFVQGNSVLTESVILGANQQLIGDGSSQSLAVAGGGSVRMPNLIAAAQTPRFDGVTGPAVTLGSNSTVAGFTFANNIGNAIVGNNISGATIRDVTLQQITGDAIRITNSTGNFNLNNVVVDTATGNGIQFSGGNPDLVFSGRVTDVQGDGLALSNLTGGSININDATFEQTGGAGLRLNNVATDVIVRSLTTSQTQGSAVAITGGTSADNYHFIGTTTIDQPNGSGFTVSNSAADVTVDNLVVNSTAGSPAISLTDTTGDLTFSNLDVETTNATGLYARNVTSLKVSEGSISSVNGAAVDIKDSTIDAVFNSISTNGGTFGISLVNTVGTFGVSGNGTYASGGTIKNTTTGVILQKAGTVYLNSMDLTTNGVAIQSANNTQVTLNTLRVTGSTGYAIDSLNDAVLIVQNSTFGSNGAIGGGTMRMLVDKVSTFQWLVQNNSIVDNNGTAILMQTTPSGAGASLATTVSQNTITASRGGATIVNIDWNGPLSVSVANNILNAQSSMMNGIVLKDSSATDSVNGRITSNTITFAGSQGTGIFTSAASSSTVQVDTNSIEFNGVGGIGIRFDLTATSTDWIYSNTITDKAGGATGMLFDHVAANSRLQIESNTISLLSTDLTVHRGIIFTSVTPTIQFSGTSNNVVTNATTAFSIPVNSSTGQFYVNGVLVP